MTTSVLFVCLGNICRSPTAEAVLRQARPAWRVDSAGTSDWHLGDPPYGPMQTAAHARGYDLSPLRARQVAVADFDAFDHVIGMDARNLSALQALRPPEARATVSLLTDFGPPTAAAVPDPYYTRDFDGALSLIERCVVGLVERIEAG